MTDWRAEAEQAFRAAMDSRVGQEADHILAFAERYAAERVRGAPFRAGDLNRLSCGCGFRACGPEHEAIRARGEGA